jgi:DNA-binding MarR family transcriptional regulator
MKLSTTTAADIRTFRRLLRQFEQLTEAQTGACCTGVSVAQCHALMAIEYLGDCSIGQLAGELDLDKSTLSRTVDGLVALGLVERTPNPADRRYMIVTLSEKGQETCRQINLANDDYYRRVFEAIPEAQRAGVKVAFEAFVVAMRSTLDKSSEPCECDG